MKPVRSAVDTGYDASNISCRGQPLLCRRRSWWRECAPAPRLPAGRLPFLPRSAGRRRFYSPRARDRSVSHSLTFTPRTDRTTLQPQLCNRISHNSATEMTLAISIEFRLGVKRIVATPVAQPAAAVAVAASPAPDKLQWLQHLPLPC